MQWDATGLGQSLARTRENIFVPSHGVARMLAPKLEGGLMRGHSKQHTFLFDLASPLSAPADCPGKPKNRA